MKPRNSTDSDRLADLQETTPLAAAARRVLSVRLEVVRDCLGQALATGNDRRKSIHALRVATRRAAAAIDVFENCLPRRIFKVARRGLRTLRRSAGAARDWDVLLQHVGKTIARAAAADRPVLDMLRGYALAHRIPAQRRLEAASPGHPFGFDRLLARCVAAVRPRPSAPASFGGHLRPIIGRLVVAFDAEAAEGDASWSRLHQIRIAGKRLRYTLELAPDTCGAPLRTHLGPALGRLQEILGDVNDSFHAAQLLRHMVTGMQDCSAEAAEAYGRVLEEQAAGHEGVMQRGRAAFCEWLRDWNSAAMQDALATIGPDLHVRWQARMGPAATPTIDPAMLLGKTA